MIFLFSIIFDIEELLNVNFNCMNFKELPNIEIVLNARNSHKDKTYSEKTITLTPEDYIIEGKKIKKKFESNEGKRNFFDVYPDLECQPAFMSIDVPAPRGPLFVFGELFLRKFYTVFDRDENIMGFSIANHETYSKIDELNITTPYDNNLNISEIPNINVANSQNSNMNEKLNLSQKSNENILDEFVFNT
jgi:hypothetical protein